MQASIRGALFTLTFCLIGAASQAGELLPLSSFTHLPRIKSASISPNGRFLAMIVAPKDRPSIAVIDLQNDSKLLGVVGNDAAGEFDVTWCRWANDERVLCGYQATASELGTHFQTTRLVSFDPDGRHLKVLIQNGARGDSQFQDNVIDFSPGIPDTVLVQAIDEDSQTHFPSVYQLNVRSGAMKVAARARPPILHFQSDNHGNVRLGWGYDGTKISYFGRLDGQTEWKLLNKFEVYQAHENRFEPFAIAAGNSVYATGDADGRSALWKLDLNDKESPQLVFSHPTVDVDTPLLTRDGRMLGVHYDTEEPHAFYTDPAAGGVVAALAKALPSTFNEIVDMSADQKTYVIRSSSDRVDADFYVFNATNGKLIRLANSYPDLPSEKLARVRWIHYPATDGTSIPGYLTVPVGAKPENLPLIVMPHGGPEDRDTFSFDALLQFLVNRGYAVLQMNFRGSTGYGAKWLYAAHQDWGGLTYSDITDGTRWAISQGIANPKRICIVGWSFGGYAALLGAVRNSDLYRCSVSIAGVSDLIGLENDSDNFTNARIARLQIGVNWDKLKTDSPLRHAKEVNIPVLLVHGTRDWQVEVHHSRNMASALKSAGKPFELVEIDGGNHQLWRESEKTMLFQSVEKFLNAQLGAGVVVGAN